MAQAAVVAATLLWSVVPLFTKVALTAFDAPFIGMARLAQAAAMAAALRPRSWRTGPRAARRLACLAGIGLGGNYVFYALGLRYTTAGATNLIVQIEVVGLLILARTFLGERLGPRKSAGALLALAGVCVVGWSGQSLRALLASQHFLGTVLVGIAGVSWSGYALLHKISLRQLSSEESLLPMFAAASLACVPFVVCSRPFTAPPQAYHWLALAVLGVPCTGLSYMLLAWGMQRVPASTMGLTTSLLPVFTIIEAALFLGESITPYIALAAASVVSGVILVSTAPSANLDTPGGGGYNTGEVNRE